MNVRWLRDPKGRLQAKDFVDENPSSAAGLANLVSHLAINGRVPKQPERGHEIHGKQYKGLWVLKPGGYRYFGFFMPGEFLLTNGAHKKTGKQQRSDYETARRLRRSFLGESDG